MPFPVLQQRVSAVAKYFRISGSGAVLHLIRAWFPEYGFLVKLKLCLPIVFVILVMIPGGLRAYWDHAWIREIPPQERGMDVRFHSIAMDNADRPHIVYVARSKLGELSLIHTVRQEESWVTNVVDPSCGDAPVRTVINASGNLHVCYQGEKGATGKPPLMYAFYDGSGWSTFAVEDGGWGCSIALSQDGLPFISHVGENGVLRFVRQNTEGWTQEDVISGAALGESTSLVVSHSGEVHIGFVSDTEPPAVTWVRGGAGSWKASVIGNGKQIGLVLDSTGYPRFVYRPAKGASVVYAQFDGVEWTKFSILQYTYMVYADQSSYYPAIAIDWKDAVHISFGHSWKVTGWGEGWIGALEYAQYDGVTWGTSSSIQTSLDGLSFASSIALDSYGFPRVSYNLSNLNGLVRFAYFVTPELSGSWSRLTFTNRKGIYYLRGNLKIINSGEGYAQSVKVQYFLSDDVTLSSDDIPAGESKKIAHLKSGKQKTARFSWSTTENPSGKYVLAVIDPEGENLQRSKTDNVVPYLIP